jgi:hypothetical protein
MKNISTGTGLCVLGLCLASYPIIDRVMPRAEAGATHVAAVVAAATAQVPPAPTIVWYGCAGSAIYRAWSSGRIEITEGSYRINTNFPCGDPNRKVWTSTDGCPGTKWDVISDDAQGLTYRSDINFDSKVDGADLSQVLNDWGNAPRQDIPPSTCPLNLINP